MSDSSGAGTTPPGWYPDPQVAGQQRWWDGTAWTEHTAPLTGAGTSQTAGSYGVGVPSATPVGATAGVRIDTWLWQSIVATVLCCLPLGIVGIVFSSQAQSAINAGNIAEAQQKAGQAKTFTLISAGLGVLPWLFFLLVVVLGMGSATMGF